MMSEGIYWPISTKEQFFHSTSERQVNKVHYHWLKKSRCQSARAARLNLEGQLNKKTIYNCQVVNVSDILLISLIRKLKNYYNKFVTNILNAKKSLLGRYRPVDSFTYYYSLFFIIIFLFSSISSIIRGYIHVIMIISINYCDQKMLLFSRQYKILDITILIWYRKLYINIVQTIVLNIEAIQ